MLYSLAYGQSNSLEEFIYIITKFKILDDTSIKYISISSPYRTNSKLYYKLQVNKIIKIKFFIRISLAHDYIQLVEKHNSATQNYTQVLR